MALDIEKEIDYKSEHKEKHYSFNLELERQDFLRILPLFYFLVWYLTLKIYFFSQIDFIHLWHYTAERTIL